MTFSDSLCWGRVWPTIDVAEWTRIGPEEARSAGGWRTTEAFHVSGHRWAATAMAFSIGAPIHTVRVCRACGRAEWWGPTRDAMAWLQIEQVSAARFAVDVVFPIG